MASQGTTYRPSKVERLEDARIARELRRAQVSAEAQRPWVNAQRLVRQAELEQQATTLSEVDQAYIDEAFPRPEAG